MSEPQVGTTVDSHFHCDGADGSSFQSSTLSLRQVGFGLGMRRKEMRRVQERYEEGARPDGARLTVYSYNSSTWKTEVGRSEVHGHPQLYGEFKANLSYETWSQTNKTKQSHEMAQWVKAISHKSLTT